MVIQQFRSYSCAVGNNVMRYCRLSVNWQLYLPGNLPGTKYSDNVTYNGWAGILQWIPTCPKSFKLRRKYFANSGALLATYTLRIPHTQPYVTFSPLRHEAQPEFNLTLSCCAPSFLFSNESKPSAQRFVQHTALKINKWFLFSHQTIWIIWIFIIWIII